MTKYKTIVAVIVMITMMALPIMALPSNAQTALTQKSYAIIDAIPNPIGVGEQTLLKYGVLQPLGSADEGWTGITITVLKPDGTTVTLGPFTTDSTGSSFTTFTPDQVGTYKLTTNFPDNIVPSTFFDLQRGGLILEGTKELAATATIDLVVQQTPLPNYPDQPLPTQYWSRPIDPQLRSWYSISGNWVSRPSNDIALYNDNAPETAHVLWAKDITTGGMAGGLWGDGQVPATQVSGDAYEGKFVNSVVIDGVLYYNTWAGVYSAPASTPPGIVAVDLHTGETLWTKQNAIVSFGQVFYFNSYNVDGVYSYVWDTSTVPGTWMAYDPFNGNILYNMTNVPSGYQYYGPSGEILILVTDWANGWMALWNSTACGQQGQSFTGPNQPDYGSWGRIVGLRTLDASNPESYSWNVTIPKGLQPTASFLGDIALKIYPDRLVGLQFNQTQVRAWALSWPASTNTTSPSTLLYDKTWAAPSEWLAGDNTIEYTGATDYLTNGVIAVWSKELREHYGFSVETGNYLWTTESENYADAYGWGNVEHTWYFAYDKLFSVGVGGTLYAYDLATGKTAWTYNLTDAYNEPVTGNYWWGWITLIADGKIYIGTVEHSAENPLPRGAPQICINATDGTEIWRVNGMFRDTRWGGNGVIGDSIIATMDTYDQRVYAIGKGPSQTTVSIQDDTVSLGDSVLFKGTVTDVSPGTNTDALKLRFPNGVPAVADEFQSDWMLYVYKQFTPPSDASGVAVSINVLDSNGNFREVGTTTSDSNGFYSVQWTPDIPGKYTVYATFGGSNAYYGSFGETSFAVGEAHPTAVPTAAPQTGLATTTDLLLYVAVGVIAIIIAIAVATVLILRKHP
jgi:hypothetical protein